MKIAITGHTAGIGQALASIYQAQGHEIVGLSRRNGYNIRNLPKLVEMIKPCDVFINNAQAGFAQTELLFAVYQAWQGQAGKKIINISTMMTSEPVSTLPGVNMTEYYIQKQALEESIRQLRYLHNWPKLCLVKPGAVATQPGQTSPRPYADVDAWAQKLVDILDAGPDLEVEEIGLGVNYG
jgi:NADP-dependent 3-hydroxy acid dehydrogenase YdfG